MDRQKRKKIIDEAGRYTFAGFSFLAVGTLATAVAAPPLLATGLALAGSFWVMDKLRVTKKK